jgi:hypothetical protein
MRAEGTFAEVLDAHLTGWETVVETPVPAVPRPSLSTPATVLDPSFWTLRTRQTSIDGSSRVANAVTSRSRLASTESPRRRTVALPSPPERQSTHPLSAAQQAAFRDLVAHGADLPDDFSAADLRRAFRSLARRYHPDTQASRGVEVQAALARHFVSISRSYRVLLDWSDARR